MSRYFFRCRACGLPHEVDTVVCPITQTPIERAHSVAPPKPRGSEPPVRINTPYGGIPAQGGTPAHGSNGQRPPTGPHAQAGRSASPSIPPPPMAPPPAPKSGSEPPLDPSMDLLPGTVVNKRYRIGKVIGRGAMGVVYDGVHIDLGRPVAVKVLAEMYMDDRVANTRFRREARITGTLGHPNIVEVFDMGELSDGTPYLVMEKLEGETLRARLQREGKLPVGDALRITKQVLSALAATHKRGIIHRDLKPENVFLVYLEGMPPIVKLVDFGLSKRTVKRDIDDTQATLTRMGFTVGTPEYMAPEQAVGDRDIDGRVDLFAVGLIGYEMLTGVRPFKATQLMDLLLEIRDMPPVPPRSTRAEVSEAFETVVLKLLASDPRDRFQTADEALGALSSA